jgi:hypothetical protein
MDVERADGDLRQCLASEYAYERIAALVRTNALLVVATQLCLGR